MVAGGTLVSATSSAMVSEFIRAMLPAPRPPDWGSFHIMRPHRPNGPVVSRRGVDVIDGVALITDSGACIPPSILSGLDVGIVPITVQFGSQEYRSGIDPEPQDLYRAIERGEPVKSVAPSPLDYLDAIEAAGDRPAVIVTPAIEFTRMFRNASLAA